MRAGGPVGGRAPRRGTGACGRRPRVCACPFWRHKLDNLYDTGAEYRVTRQITLSAYAGYTQGLASIEQICSRGKDGEFGYLELLYRF